MRGFERGGCSRGFTLIELMISMVIGLIVMAAIASVYLANRQTYTTTDALSRLQEQARYAALIVRDSIMHAGYYGLIEGPIPINGRAGTTNQLPATAVSDDCGNRWAIDLANPIEAPDTTGGNPFLGTCFDSATWRHDTVANADMLAVRRVNPQMVLDNQTAANDAGFPDSPLLTDSDEDGRLFVRTDTVHGEIFVNDSSATPPAGYDQDAARNFRLESEIFYVAPNSHESDDGIPALRRMWLSTDRMESGLVMSGIEQFQVQIGEDNNGDNVPDLWTDPPNANASRARAIRFWLLVRAPDMERDYTDTNTYTMGDVTYTPSGDAQRYRRTLVVQTVSLRNLQE